MNRSTDCSEQLAHRTLVECFDWNVRNCSLKSSGSSSKRPCWLGTILKSFSPNFRLWSRKLGGPKGYKLPYRKPFQSMFITRERQHCLTSHGSQIKAFEMSSILCDIVNLSLWKLFRLAKCNLKQCGLFISAKLSVNCKPRIHLNEFVANGGHWAALIERSFI